jgi:hypothetical protein
MPARHFTAALAAAFIAGACPADAQPRYIAPVMAYVTSKVMPWINDPIIINAVKAQNEAHATLSQQQIDKLDRQWAQEMEAPEKPLIDSVLGSKASLFLQRKQAESAGSITEIFVMDNKGLNVAEGDATTDYWQGDEAKFQKTYGVGPDAIFVDEPRKDDSTRLFQVQASFTLKDETGKAIGAVTVGVNLDNL